MAPETIRYLREDIKIGYGVDVWALGVVLFELIHGRTPFTRRHILKDWDNRDTCEYDACLRKLMPTVDDSSYRVVHVSRRWCNSIR